jgi:glucokinase
LKRNFPGENMGPSDKGKDQYWVGFDLGGTKMLAMVFDSKLNAVGKERKKTRGFEGQKVGIARIISTIEAALKDAGVNPKQCRGIGVGAPGPLDLEKGILLETPNLGWSNVKLAKILEEHFRCPAILGNDVDIGTYGEYRFGAARKARCVVGLFPGTGIGGACIYEGRMIRGVNFSCMEIGHIPIQPQGPNSGAGLRGTLESLASRLAISSAAAAAAYRGDAPHLLSIAGTDVANIRSAALAQSVALGDKAVEEIIRQAGAWMGIGLASAVHLLAPDVILLGGGLVEAMPDVLTEEIEKSLKKHLMPSFKKSFEIRTASLGDYAGVTGAAAWAQENFCSTS